MSGPLVFPPLRQETLLSIRARLERDLNAGRDPDDENFWDLTPGSVPADLLMAVALEFERLWDMASVDLPAASLVEFAWGDYLDAHGMTVEVDRGLPSPSHGEVTFSTEEEEEIPIPIGAEIGTVQIDPEAEPVTFRVTAGGVVPKKGSVTLPAEAVEPGSAGNVPQGAVDELLTAISGVEVTNESAFQDGEDRESDDSYRERLKIAYSASRGGGSVDDLRAWSLAWPGIGYVRVTPLWLGPGSVRVVVTDTENNPVSKVVEAELQAFLDPVNAATTLSEKTTLPKAAIKVASTKGFAAAGRLIIDGQLVDYTSIVGNEFKGATGGTGEHAAASEVIQGGLGRGMAPPGSIISVDTPVILPVIVEAEIAPDDGFNLTGAEGLADLTEDIEAALADYINKLPPGGEDPPGEESPPGSGSVLVNRVKKALLEVDGVYDVGTILLNGGEGNLTVGALEVPQLEKVELEAL